MTALYVGMLQRDAVVRYAEVPIHDCPVCMYHLGGRIASAAASL